MSNIQILNPGKGIYEPLEVFIERGKEQMQKMGWTVEREMVVVKRVVRFANIPTDEVLRMIEEGLRC